MSLREVTHSLLQYSCSTASRNKLEQFYDATVCITIIRFNLSRQYKAQATTFAKGGLFSAATLTTHFPTQNMQSKHFHACYDPNGPHIASVWAAMWQETLAVIIEPRRKEGTLVSLTTTSKFSSTFDQICRVQNTKSGPLTSAHSASVQGHLLTVPSFKAYSMLIFSMCKICNYIVVLRDIYEKSHFLVFLFPINCDIT